MSDYLVRVIARESGVRGLACIATGLVNDAARRHQASSTTAAVLGHGLTAAALMGALLKVRQRVAIKFEGDGPARKIVVESDSYGHLRGYVQVPDVVLPHAVAPNDVAAAIGQAGLLTVAKDLGLKDLYKGVVPLQNGQVDSEIAHYLSRSEQVPSLVEIGVLLGQRDWVDVAGGLLFQTLPGQDAAILKDLAGRLDDLPPVEQMLAGGRSPEEILDQLLVKIPYEVLERRDLSFRCSCSRERSAQAIRLLGRAEIESLIAEGEAVVDCHFCHERYIFDRAELGEILEKVTG